MGGGTDETTDVVCAEGAPRRVKGAAPPQVDDVLVEVHFVVLPLHVTHLCFGGA
jgi:hypothetical protein